MRPVIGITSRPRTIQTSGGDLGADTVQHTYRTSVARAGGLPIHLAPVDDDDVPVLLSRIDGLVLTGGGDVDPSVYGGTRDDTMYDIHPERDAFEMALTREAAAIRLPMLAICRGLQVLNVTLGGTLVADIPTAYGSRAHSVIGQGVAESHQRVAIEPASSLARLVGTDLMVNSIHHQAVDRLGRDLRIVARAEDGVVEAIESTEPSWTMMAVQWHPEYLADAGDAASQILFEALIEAAGKPI